MTWREILVPELKAVLKGKKEAGEDWPALKQLIKQIKDDSIDEGRAFTKLQELGLGWFAGRLWNKNYHIQAKIAENAKKVS